MKKAGWFVIILIILGGLSGSQCRADDDNHRRSKWYRFWEDDDKDEKKYYDRSFHNAQRISAAKARRIVLDSFPEWRVGEGWEEKDDDEIEIIITLEYQGKIIGDIVVHPVTGKILPEDTESSSRSGKITIGQAVKVVRQALPKMIIGDNIRLGKHGNYWEVPLLYRGMEVEEIKVGTGTGTILPDWHIEEDAYKHRHHKYK